MYIQTIQNVSKCTYMFKEYLHLSFVNLSIFYTINSNLKSDHFFSIKCLEQIKSKKKMTKYTDHRMFLRSYDNYYNLTNKNCVCWNYCFAAYYVDILFQPFLGTPTHIVARNNLCWYSRNIIALKYILSPVWNSHLAHFFVDDNTYQFRRIYCHPTL